MSLEIHYVIVIIHISIYQRIARLRVTSAISSSSTTVDYLRPLSRPAARTEESIFNLRIAKNQSKVEAYRAVVACRAFTRDKDRHRKEKNNSVALWLRPGGYASRVRLEGKEKRKGEKIFTIKTYIGGV